MTAKIIPFPKPKPAPEAAPAEDHSVRAMLEGLRAARQEHERK